MSELRSFLVAVINRYREEGGDVVDVVDIIAGVLVEQGYTIITNEQYVDLCAKDHCPYCNRPLGEPVLDFDHEGYSRATWICTECEAVAIRTLYPPPMKED